MHGGLRPTTAEGNSLMRIGERFLGAARAAFEWTAALDFAEVASSVGNDGGALTLRGPAVSLVISLDGRDDALECRILRLIDGREPRTQFFVPLDPDQVTSVGFSSILRAAGREDIVQHLLHAAMDDQEWLERALASMADAVQQYALPILEGDMGEFRIAARHVVQRAHGDSGLGRPADAG